MSTFLMIFSAFNLVAAAASAGAGMRLISENGQDGWVSARLFRIAQVMSWGMVAVSLASTGAAWQLYRHDAHYGLLVLAPIAWLLVMGLIFAIVDFAEDGVFDFGHGPKSRGP